MTETKKRYTYATAKSDRTTGRIIEALQECNGLITLASKRTGLHYRTIERYIADCPAVREAAQLAKEKMIDLAESKLYEKIEQGEVAPIIFYLKTQAKDRGYIERGELLHKHVVLEVRIVDRTKEKLLKEGDNAIQRPNNEVPTPKREEEGEAPDENG